MLKSKITQLYGSQRDQQKKQLIRWKKLISEHHKEFSSKEVHLFSTPGRTEIGGNHTDHNHGKVLAASIDLDSIAAVAKTSTKKITVRSQGYKSAFGVDLDDLSLVESERGITSALIRGVAARFKQLGYHIGGFNAYITSDVLVGSGLSSSASIEVLIATILNSLYNKSSIDPLKIAMIGQYAENVYFGKPCGLMDQITCAVGGIVTIDFKDPHSPKVEKVDCDFDRSGFSLLVVDTGGNHADLTEDYASIPREMKSVAKYFGREFCRDVTEKELIKNLQNVRSKVGDRAVLRALHFIEENNRVDLEVAALKKNDFPSFLELIRESGNSSFRWLQNCYTTRNVTGQSVSLALALTERYVEKIGSGACRVHGGGFAGTIQVFLPRKNVPEYVKTMESAFRPGCVRELHIRTIGTIKL